MVDGDFSADKIWRAAQRRRYCTRGKERRVRARVGYWRGVAGGHDLEDGTGGGVVKKAREQGGEKWDI